MCTVQLVSGSAELFGAELATNKKYNLAGAKVAIFTWHGCELEVNGKLDIAYVSTETVSNATALHAHAHLSALRDDAALRDAPGPRVLVAGGPDSGKSSLARTLLAYAVKFGHRPVFVDVDVSSNSLSVPGTLAASPAPDGVDADAHASGVVPRDSSPLVLWYGSTDLASNPHLYRNQLDTLGEKLRARDSPAGILVDASGWIEDAGYDLLLHVIRALDIDVVLVLGHDRLYSMLTTDLHAKIVKLPRSGGVVARDEAWRRKERMRSLRGYFHGEVVKSAENSASHRYTPFLREIDLDAVVLHELSSINLSASMLPVSAKQATDPVQMRTVELKPSHKHAIFAVCHPDAVERFRDTEDPKDLYQVGIAGVVAVENIDMEKGVVSFLCPAAGELPSYHFLVGDITWME